MIDRYVVHYYLDGAGLKKHGYGDWCKYEDAQKLEQQNQELWQWLANIYQSMKEQSGDPFEECPFCMGELFGYDEQLKLEEKFEAIRGEE